MIINNIKHILDKNNISVEQFSKETGIDHEKLTTLYFNENINIDNNILNIICYRFNCSIDSVIKHIPIKFKLIDVDVRCKTMTIELTDNSISEIIKVDYLFTKKRGSWVIYQRLDNNKNADKILNKYKDHSDLILRKYINDTHKIELVKYLDKYIENSCK